MSSGSSIGDFQTYAKKKRLERSGLEKSNISARPAPLFSPLVENSSILRNNSAKSFLSFGSESEKENEPPKKVTKSPVKDQFYSLRNRGKSRIPFQEIEIIPNRTTSSLSEPSFEHDLIDVPEVETNQNQVIETLVSENNQNRSTQALIETNRNRAIKAPVSKNNQNRATQAHVENNQNRSIQASAVETNRKRKAPLSEISQNRSTQATETNRNRASKALVFETNQNQAVEAPEAERHQNQANDIEALKEIISDIDCLKAKVYCLKEKYEKNLGLCVN